MSYRLLLMDVDSTLINEEVIDLLADYANVGEEVAAITKRAMSGEIDFETALRDRLALLKNQPVSILTEVLSQITFTQGAKELITTLKNLNWRVGVVSGGFREVLDPLCRGLSLDFIHANRLKTHANLLTGEIEGKIVDKDAKKEALEKFAGSFNIPIKETVAIGDGANDVEMIKAAGIGVSFCAKPILEDFADFKIKGRDLMHLLDILETRGVDISNQNTTSTNII